MNRQRNTCYCGTMGKHCGHKTYSSACMCLWAKSCMLGKIPRFQIITGIFSQERTRREEQYADTSQWIFTVSNNNETCSLEISDYFYFRWTSGTENSHFSFSKLYTVKLILLKKIPVLGNTILISNVILKVMIVISQLPRLRARWGWGVGESHTFLQDAQK